MDAPWQRHQDAQAGHQHLHQDYIPNERELSYSSAAALSYRPHELRTYLSGGHILQDLASEPPIHRSVPYPARERDHAVK